MNTSFWFLLFALGVQIIAADYSIVPRLYEEIGCTEVQGDSNTRSFKCPDFSTNDPNKCYVNGRAFNIGDDVHSDIICKGNCKCIKYDRGAGIICPIGGCAIGYKPNCIRIYKDAKSCCPHSEICDEEKIRSLHTCQVDGYTYYDGEPIFPNDVIFPNDRAYRCHCTPDFNNATAYADNPSCVRKDGCGLQYDSVQMEYLRLGCVPVYSERPDNCPWNTHYTCPTRADVIVSQANSVNRGGQTCKFGALTLNVGDKIKTINECAACECAIPPFITCLKTC